MKQIELYINNRLCDLGNIRDFSVHLKRQFLSPLEVNAKDTQRSYDITLPATPHNNAIFGYLNTEEVGSKFARLHPAQLIIGGVKILDGSFKLSEITARHYKGNLGTPASKTMKEIFGEKPLNKAGEVLAAFPSLSSITDYNQSEGIDGMRFFFPLVMYGLLPKVPSASGAYEGKSTIDDTVRFGLEDFPPSLNCLDTLKQIFKSHELNLTGTAFSDERLSNLYMSYKNPSDYDMPWNYGDLAKMRIKGSWSNGVNVKGGRNGKKPYWFEPSVVETNSDIGGQYIYSKDILNSANVELAIVEDAGSNIVSYETSFKYEQFDGEVVNRSMKRHSVRIPASGYYKIVLKGDITLPYIIGAVSGSNTEYYDTFRKKDGNGIHLASPRNSEKFMNRLRYELKLVRDWGEGDFNIDNVGLDGTFFENNFNQSYDKWDKEAGEDLRVSYFPNIDKKPDSGNKPCQIQFIDPAQNPNMVVGFSWGKKDEGGRGKRWNPYVNTAEDIDEHPDKRKGVWAQVLAAKSCYSWDKDQRNRPLSRVIVHNPKGYIGYYNEPIMARSADYSKEPRSNEAYFQPVDNFKMQLDDTPELTYARRGYKDGERLDYEINSNEFGQLADGCVCAVVWFEKGERLTLVSSSEQGDALAWVWQQLNFDLSIEPFRTDRGWAEINEYKGSINKALSWNDEPTGDLAEYGFATGDIDLMKFLPSEVKVDEWIDNFCKAFNLELLQKDETHFELNIKKGLKANTSLIIDLDKKAHVTADRQNVPFGLPKAYEIGFTVDKDEIGYVESTRRVDKNDDYIRDPMGEIKAFEGEDGGGRFETGSPENSIVKQTSNFSYNWMKEMQGKGSFYKDAVFPVISDKEAWEPDSSDYAEMMQKDYVDKAQRFWYKSKEHYDIKINDKVPVKAALVTDTFDDGSQRMVLDYKDKPDSILRNYFTVFTDAQNCYTQVECYLSPEEYERLEDSLVRFNGDFYHVAEVEGYDPKGIRKTTLKLIRKML